MNDNTPLELLPLNVKCTDADCEHDLHCFKFLSRSMEAEDEGACRYCGAKLIDWDRVHLRSLRDIANTFRSLKREYIRHALWHKPIDLKAELHARRKGVLLLRESAYKRIRSSVGRATPFRDGQQTPMEGNILYYAQHATASCCRTCMEYWHAIPKGRQLTDDEINYFTDLAMLYVADRMPELPDSPEKIPRRIHV
jgi:hypothetical protein